eukprot:g1869.t1
MHRPLLQGYLTKQGKSRTSWRVRWCVLLSDRIVYYKRKESKKSQGCIEIRSVLDVRVDEVAYPEPHCFQLKCRRNASVPVEGETIRTYAFRAQSNDECSKWIRAIRSRVSGGDSAPGETESSNPDRKGVEEKIIESPHAATKTQRSTSNKKRSASSTRSPKWGSDVPASGEKTAEEKGGGGSNVGQQRVDETPLRSAATPPSKRTLHREPRRTSSKLESGSPYTPPVPPPVPATSPLPAARLGQHFLPEDEEVTLHQLTRYCMWIDSLDVWEVALCPDGEKESPSIRPAEIANHFTDGLLLCRIVARFTRKDQCKQIFKQLHEKATSKRTAISNIEKGLLLAFSHSPRTRFMPQPEDIYEARPGKVALMIREICHACALRVAWQHVRSTMRWFDRILATFGRPLSSDALRGSPNGMWDAFRDGVSIACVLFWFGGAIESEGDSDASDVAFPGVDLERIFETPSLDQMRSNLNYVFEKMERAGIEVVWHSDDFLSFPNDDFLVLQLHNIRKRFQTTTGGNDVAASHTTTRPSALRWITRLEANNGIVGILTTVDADERKTHRVCNARFASTDRPVSSVSAHRTLPTKAKSRKRRVEPLEEEDGGDVLVLSPSTDPRKSRPSPVLRGHAEQIRRTRRSSSDDILRLVHSSGGATNEADNRSAHVHHGGWPHGNDGLIQDDVQMFGRGRKRCAKKIRDSPRSQIAVVSETKVAPSRERGIEELRARVETERKLRLVERMRSYGILSPGGRAAGDGDPEEPDDDILALGKDLKDAFLSPRATRDIATVAAAMSAVEDSKFKETTAAEAEQRLTELHIPGLVQLAAVCATESTISPRRLRGHTIRDAESLFRAMDLNGDGALTLEELQGAAARLDIALTDRQCLELFRFMDHDRDGTIDVEEFQTALLGHVPSSYSPSTRVAAKKRRQSQRVSSKIRESLYGVQRELIQREEEVAMLEEESHVDDSEDDFRRELELAARREEIAELKREREDLIAALQDSDVNDEIENDDRDRIDAAVGTRAHSPEVDKKNHDLLALSNAEVRVDTFVEGADPDTSFRDWQRRALERMQEEKSRWIAEYDSRLEEFDRKMRNRFEAEKAEMLKMLEGNRAMESSRWETEFSERNARSKKQWEAERQRLEHERSAFIADEINLRRRMKNDAMREAISSKETRYMKIEDARMQADIADRRREAAKTEVQDQMEINAIVRWLAAPKLVTIRRAKGGKPMSCLLALMRITPAGVLPATRAGDALILRWCDVESKKERGRAAVVSMMPLSAPSGCVLSIRFRSSDKSAAASNPIEDNETTTAITTESSDVKLGESNDSSTSEIVFIFPTNDDAVWYFKAIRELRGFEVSYA